MRIHKGLLMGGLLCLLAVGLNRAGEGMEGLKPRDLLPTPDGLKGWTLQGEPISYRGENLIDYINGGAELYFEYGFQEVWAQEYVHTSGATLTVEIYELDRSENAFGVYSFDTHGEHPPIGQEATYGFGLLRFWKGRFFCRLLSLSEQEGIREVLLTLGKRITEKIPEDGRRPEILAHLPATKATPESVRYFHKQIALSNVYYLSDENLLNLGTETEAIFFEYQLPPQPAKVLLVRYPQKADADAAYFKFLRIYFPEEKINEDQEEIIALVEKSEYTGIRRSQNLLVLVFEVKERKACQSILVEMAGARQ